MHIYKYMYICRYINISFFLILCFVVCPTSMAEVMIRQTSDGIAQRMKVPILHQGMLALKGLERQAPGIEMGGPAEAMQAPLEQSQMVAPLEQSQMVEQAKETTTQPQDNTASLERLMAMLGARAKRGKREKLSEAGQEEAQVKQQKTATQKKAVRGKPKSKPKRPSMLKTKAQQPSVSKTACAKLNYPGVPKAGKTHEALQHGSWKIYTHLKNGTWRCKQFVQIKLVLPRVVLRLLGQRSSRSSPTSDCWPKHFHFV